MKFRNQTKNQICRKKWRNQGTTLVEMIVCFALLAILMVTATEIIHSAMSTYSEVKKSSAGQEVSELICDKIEADLSGASSRQIPNISGDNREIFYYDRYNRPVTLQCNSAGYLHFSYGKESEESYWEFDPQIYRGYTITDIKFKKAMPETVANRRTEDQDDEDFLSNEVYSNDIYKVELTIYSKQNGAYVTDRYIRCRSINE